jgi:hypothetical protein
MQSLWGHAVPFRLHSYRLSKSRHTLLEPNSRAAFLVISRVPILKPSHKTPCCTVVDGHVDCLCGRASCETASKWVPSKSSKMLSVNYVRVVYGEILKACSYATGTAQRVPRGIA